MASIYKLCPKWTSTRLCIALTFLIILGLIACLPLKSIQAKPLFAPIISVNGDALGDGNVSFTITNGDDTAVTDYTWELFVDGSYISNAAFSLAAGESTTPAFSSLYGMVRLDVKNNGGTVVASDTVLSPVNTPVPTNTFTNTPSPTKTFTPSHTFTPTNTPTHTYTPSSTAVPSNTPTSTNTSTALPTRTSTSLSISSAKYTETKIPLRVFVYTKAVGSITPTKPTLTQTGTSTQVSSSGSTVQVVAQLITSTTTKTNILPIPPENAQQGTRHSLPFWLWIIIAMVLIVMIGLVLFMRRKKLQG